MIVGENDRKPGMRTLLVLFLLFTTVAHAEDGGLLPGLVSEPLSVPVTISGDALSLDGFVVRPDRPGRFPLVLMLHGTPGAGGDAFFAALVKRSPVNFNTPAIAFAQRGYAAVAIMRRGFGRSGGAYAESLPWECDYLSAVRVSAQDVIAALASLRKQPWVDADHVVLLGHSTGGLAVTAAAAEKPAGVVAILNFDGGRHSPSSSGQMCSLDSLVDTWAALGRGARIPALWLYAENDRSYGPDLVRRMFDAYAAGGAPAQLQMLPPFGSDGHDLITTAPANAWLPTVEPFLAALALPSTPVIALPPPPELPSPPGAVAVCAKVFTDYLAYRSDAKAFAVTPRGGCGGGIGRTIDEARDNALAECKANTRGGACRLYAIGQRLAEQ
jgi:dienelactone hydrolase